jgi:DNA-binding LacI/PurR family transcriptional regulator
VIDQRLHGWLDALSGTGVRAVLASQPNVYEDARPVATELLTAPDRPTAVLCLTDVIARDVLAAALELDIAVPDELSIVGFDDSPLAARSHPGLTTVAQDVDAKGLAAARALRQAMLHATDPAEPRPRSRRLGVELVVRQSTGPVG